MKHPHIIDGQELGTGVDELHEAQIRKLNHIIHKADIRPGHRVRALTTPILKHPDRGR